MQVLDVLVPANLPKLLAAVVELARAVLTIKLTSPPAATGGTSGGGPDSVKPALDETFNSGAPRVQ